MHIRSQQGLSMIEVLVGLFVLAIGILGQMAMQMTSLASSQSSYYRSQAVSIANDLADRVRVNSYGAINSVTNYDDITIDEDSNHTMPNCYSVGCSLSNQVSLDIYEIQQLLRASIPGGTLSMERIEDIDTPMYRVIISWSADDRLANADEFNELVMDFGI